MQSEENIITKQTISKLKEVHSPKVKWFTLNNFYLPNIPKKFIMSDFQRRQNAAHIRKIVEAILNNEFFDNVIRCVKLKGDQYEVIDGQHRLKALWICYKNYGITNYTIVMQLFEHNDTREVFRRLNSGKHLTPYDILKTFDMGNIPFFDELREYVNHYKTGTNMTFLQLLKCVNYKNNPEQSQRELPMRKLKDTLDGITADEISYLYRQAKAVHFIYKKSLNTMVFHANLNRIVFSLGVKHNFSFDEFVKFFEKILFDKEIIELCHRRWSDVHDELLAKIKTYL